MIDITKYQTNYSSDSPEKKAKDLALQEAYVPEEIGFVLTPSSSTKSVEAPQKNEEGTSPQNSIQNDQKGS
jgi:hypothetical protein